MKIYQALAKIKAELHTEEIKKSGHNKYAGFKYHELQDFLPHIARLNEKHGVDDSININRKSGTCSITLTAWEDGSKKTIVLPMEEAEMLAKGGATSNVDKIQRLGATITYLRRYLYMTAYDITESDSVDAGDNKETKDDLQDVKKQLNDLISEHNYDKKAVATRFGLNVKSTREDYEVAINTILAEVV